MEASYGFNVYFTGTNDQRAETASKYVHTVFQTITCTLCRLVYALPAWSPFTTLELLNNTDAFLKRSNRYGFVSRLNKIQLLHGKPL